MMIVLKILNLLILILGCSDEEKDKKDYYSSNESDSCDSSFMFEKLLS